MNPNEITQPNNEEMTPEDAKAALGLSTRLSEELLMSQAPEEGMEEPETPPAEPQEDVRAIVKEEMDKFKQEIITILEDEKNNDPKVNN